MLNRIADRIIALLFFWRSFTRGYAALKPNRSRAVGMPAGSPIGEEAESYWRIPISAFGHRGWLLLTPTEFERATKRASAQPEDCRLPSTRVSKALWPVE